MDWTVEARRNDTRVEVRIVGDEAGDRIGPFVVRLHPPLPGTPVRVDGVEAGSDGVTLSIQDRAYQAMYVTAELLNAAALVERIRSTEVR